MPVAIICGFCSETVRQMNKWQTIEPLVEMQAVFLCAKGARKNRKVFYHLHPSWCYSVKKVQRKTIIPLWALRSYVRCLWLILQPWTAHSFYGPLFNRSWRYSGWSRLVCWGFIYKSVALVWLKKNNKADSWFYGLGFWTRGNAEICLLVTRENPKRQTANIILLFLRLRHIVKGRTRPITKIFP